jgi:hypothetical protein
MRDETISTKGASSSDFDLDAFLRENNFLIDEEAKKAEKDTKAKNDTKQTSKQSKRRATAKRSASDEDGAGTTDSGDNPAPPDTTTDASFKSAKDSVKATKSTKETRNTVATRSVKAGRDTGITTDSDGIKDTGDTTRETPSAKTAKSEEGTGSAGSIKSTKAINAADPNATMSYATLGVNYPEFPLVENETPSNTTKATPALSGKQDSASQTDMMSRAGIAPRTDVASQAGIASQAGVASQTDIASQKTSSSRASSRASSRTSSRASSASRTLSEPNANASTSRTAQSVAASDPPPTNATGKARAAASSARKSRSATEAAAIGATGAAVRAAAGAPAASTLRAHPTAGSPAEKKRGRSESVARSAAKPRRASQLATLANPDDFHPAEFVDNAYHIRGGGRRHNKRSPVMVILIAMVIISGIGLLGFFLWDAFQGLLGKKPVENVVTLSASETREAIDTEMPVLLDYIWSGSEGAYAVFVDNGWNVVMPGRDTSDNPDATALGNEVIHLAPGVDTAVLESGYYASEFDGYSYDELQANFNGAWMLDISQGDSGVYAQLKYVNFASDSLTSEFQHLRELQGLAGENSVVVSDGLDGFGNSYLKGYLVIDEVTYYWELIGIAFESYYGGQDRRSLPETAVYVKCRVANFDFYGIESSPPST